MNLKNLITSLLIIAIIAVATFAVVLAIYPLIIPSTGTVQLEYGLSASPANINWGNVTLGVPVIQTVDIENIGTKNITSLAMTYQPCPNLINYTLTWDYEGFGLPIGYYVTANFTLTVYEAVEGPFSFDIYINVS